MAFDLTQLLKLFYRSGLPYLPVLSSGLANPTAAEREEATGGPVLLGFLARALVDRQASDLERISEQHSRLPANLLITRDIPGDLIGALGQADRIPVLDQSGQEVRVWTSSEFLAAFSSFQTLLKARGAAEAATEAREAGAPTANSSGQVATESPEGGSAASGGDWLSRLVLGGFPHPLFACDLNGKTLFYNEAFEAVVLAQPALKNSIRLAESYFLELTRELLARSLQQGGRQSPLRARLPEMQMALEIATLDADGRVMGYLYIFRDLVWTGFQYELQDMLAGGMGLDDIVDEIEGALIYSVLKEQGQNVSHAAHALGVKRSTLQNKIKRLNIDEKYDRKIDGPIRRRRRPLEEDADEPAVRLNEIAPKKESPPKKGGGSKSSSARSPKKTTKKATTKSGSKSSPKSAKKSAKRTAKKSSAKKTARKPRK